MLFIMLTVITFLWIGFVSIVEVCFPEKIIPYKPTLVQRIALCIEEIEKRKSGITMRGLAAKTVFIAMMVAVSVFIVMFSVLALLLW